MLKRLRKLLGKVNPEEAQKEYLIANGLKIGKNCDVFSWNGIDPGKPWLIEIGNDVTISSNVSILTHDASPYIVGCGTKLGRVTIGNNVFIGVKATILCDVRIGDNVVVGAGSVVTRDLESNGVYSGVPAKRICSIDEYRIKYQRLRDERPDFSTIHKWNEWSFATEEEKQYMFDKLNDGPGFF